MEGLKQGLYIVKIWTMHLLRTGLQQWLRLTVKIGNVAFAVSSDVPVVTLPAVRGLVHKVRAKEDVAPVLQRLHPLPLAVRKGMNTRLMELKAKGVIERLDSLSWV